MLTKAAFLSAPKEHLHPKVLLATAPPPAILLLLGHHQQVETPVMVVVPGYDVYYL